MPEQRTFLATTALDEFWNKTKPILFLGEWCTPYKNKSVWESLDAETLDSPLINLDPDETLKYVESIYNDLMPMIANWLNKVHNTNHSIKYWEVIAGSYLFIHIQTTYDRYCRIKKAYELFPQLETIGLSVNSYITPLNISEYYMLTLQSDLWNLQICTQIIKSLFNNITKYRDHSGQSEIKQRLEMIDNSSYKFISQFKHYLMWLLVRLRGSKTFALIQKDFNRENLFNLTKLSRFKILPLSPRRKSPKLLKNLYNNPVNLSLRIELSSLQDNDMFSKIVLELLVYSMPMSLIENYNTECKISKMYYPYYAKAVGGSPVAGNESLKIWQARFYNKGMKTVGLQHGGGYGALKSISDEYLEHKYPAYYISWGKASSTGKIMRLPSIPISEQIGINKDRIKSLNRNSQILWVTTEFTRYPMPEIKLSLGAGYYERLYYTWQKEILKKLKQEIFSNITMRLRFSDFSDTWEYIKEEFPTLNVVKPTDRASFYTQLMESKLLLFDNLNTTHLYGLAMNIPTLLFWDERIWTIREDVKEYFDDLVKVGILHLSPESASSMINKISDDSSTWWHDNKVQAARKKYCDYFVGHSENWLQDWNEVLTSILSKN